MLCALNHLAAAQVSGSGDVKKKKRRNKKSGAAAVRAACRFVQSCFAVRGNSHRDGAAGGGGGGGLDSVGGGGLQNGADGGEGAGFRVFVGNLAWTTQSPVTIQTAQCCI